MVSAICERRSVGPDNSSRLDLVGAGTGVVVETGLGEVERARVAVKKAMTAAWVLD